MFKYIIKNCGCNPACDECYIRCKDITDCVMKRIVEKCKSHHNDLHFTASEVLSLLDIEECE